MKTSTPKNSVQDAPPRKNIAVIGSGISGLSCAWLLSRSQNVTLFEKDDRLGGHSNTVTFDLDKRAISVDTGFIVYNPVNYPNLVKFFEQLGVKTCDTDMSFSVSVNGGELEYSGSGLSGLLAQKRNLLRPAFWGMVADLLRFYRQSPKLLQSADLEHLSLGELLEKHRYGKSFIYNHLKSNKYERIIICNLTLILFLFDIKKIYGGKVIYDVRDYSIVIKFFKPVFKNLFKSSEYNFISSLGFKLWLPKNINYKLIHNLDFNQKSYLDHRKIKKPIKISVFGSIRDYNANLFLIKSIQNDLDFNVSFFGLGPKVGALNLYCKKNNIKNVMFFGYYEPKNERNIISNSDIIYNFTNFDINSRTLITNRFYRALFNFKPQIIRKKTFQAQLCLTHKFGVVIDKKDNMKKTIIENIEYFNSIQFIQNCKNMINEINSDINSYKSLRK